MSNSELAKLNDLALEFGWREALKKVYGAESNMFEYVTSPRRLKVLEIVPTQADDSVLEIGCGLGQFTVALSRRVASVQAIDISPEQVRFAELRCRQEGQSKVEFRAAGEEGKLPFGDATFSGVIFNLVFEWCASHRADDAGAFQRKYLSEILRVLKPGGYCLITTKNRFALRYILGARDEHTAGIRFGSALPRCCTRWLLRFKRLKAGGLLHSHNGLKNILGAAGFKSSESFWLAPEMRYPTVITSTDAESIREARQSLNFQQAEGRVLHRIMRLLPASLVKHFSYGLCFIVRR